MEIEYTHKRIKFEKELNQLDEFTIDFCSILNKLNIKYVIISGYIAILFGRNRASEDIDIFIEKIEITKFRELWDSLKEFECLNSLDVKDAFEEYLMNDESVRFSRKNEFVPNAELKFIKNSLDEFALNNRIEVNLNEKILFISHLEMQIAFKLSLGSKKDIEDARFVYGLFKDKLNLVLLEEFIRKLKVEAQYRMYLK